MRIILDSNTFIADFRMGGAKFHSLKSHLERSGEKLCVHEVVFDEVVNKFRERLEEQVADLSKAGREIGRMIDKDLRSPLTPEEAAAEVPKYREWFRRQLVSMNAVFLPYPEIQHELVARRSMARKKPFGEKDKGYRDYLIWAAILADLKGNVGDIVFTSCNPKDFADDNRTSLHEDLLADLAREKIDPKRLRYYPTFEALLDGHILPQLASLDKVRDDLNAGKFIGFNLATWMDKELPDLLQGHPIDDFQDESAEPELTGLENIENIDVTAVRKLSEKELLIEALVTLECDVGFFIEKSDYWGMSDESSKDMHIVDGDWNDHVMAVESGGTAECRLFITLDTSKNEVTSTDIEELRWVSPDE